jgi:chromosomal replication initiation ATPase DnaA
VEEIDQKIMRIIEEEAKANGTTVGVLINHDRMMWRCAIRQRIMWRARTELKASYPAIGRVMRRTHAAILRGVRTYEER